jgi:hypothetical protein
MGRIITFLRSSRSASSDENRPANPSPDDFRASSNFA